MIIIIIFVIIYMFQMQFVFTSLMTNNYKKEDFIPFKNIWELYHWLFIPIFPIIRTIVRYYKKDNDIYENE